MQYVAARNSVENDVKSLSIRPVSVKGLSSDPSVKASSVYSAIWHHTKRSRLFFKWLKSAGVSVEVSPQEYTCSDAESLLAEYVMARKSRLLAFIFSDESFVADDSVTIILRQYSAHISAAGVLYNRFLRPIIIPGEDLLNLKAVLQTVEPIVLDKGRIECPICGRKGSVQTLAEISHRPGCSYMESICVLKSSGHEIHH
ncbi:MAG: hypothetical protein KatS3mg087_2197 [Patescibacteria group bacterium]|nr:MAG: hypothetical protein KatS3mg087_2197 [Patescibacteria group bacterium]